MRQIHGCAWLLVTCSIVAACGGQEFSTGEASGATNGAPNDRAGAAAFGESSEDPPAAASGSKSSSASGGQASGGAMSGGAPASAHAGASTPGTGATTNEGGATTDDVACESGAITFRMLPSPELPAGFFCDTGCGSGWLTITDAEGYTAFSISSACGVANCGSCEALPCAAAACLPTPLPAEGAKLVWTGVHLAKDTCGPSFACQRATCVPPGKYKAKACADISAGSSELAGTCAAKSSPACAEVTFDFPAEDTIDLVLKKP